ncbi:BTAD domain-containing putative transcriptional regulator [Cryptosporangium sp. NPDC048952]|uniref:BTAD domain-containing putative transcriptional regulator n=1 Tax=Cryptosporangium sp. NPDC048952 TaxID=3363961 RepID=UPI00371911FB
MEVDGAEPALRFAVLGPLRSWRGGQALDLGPGKQRAVLAVLLLDANRVVPAQRIVEAVWDDDPPENGANVVQKYVAGLRRVLEPERSPRAPSQVLTLSDGGYRLHVGEFDVQTFQIRVRKAEALRRGNDTAAAAAELRRGLELWRGQPLAGLSGRWFDARRQQLADQYAAAWESLAELELELGRHSGLTTELGRLVGEYPGREGLRAALMLALYRSGRQVEALAAYRDAQEHLREEFGVDPGDHLRELHQRILSSDPTLALPSRAKPSAPDGPPDAAPEPTLPPSSSARPVLPPPPPYGLAHPSPAPLLPGPPSYPVSPPASINPPATDHRALIGWIRAVFFTTLAVCTLGHATFLVVGYYGLRRRNTWNIIAAVAYLLGTLGLWVWAAILPTDPETEVPLTPWDWLLLPSLVVSPLVGAVHIFALEMFNLNRMKQDDNAAEITNRMDRERALQMVTHHPEMARELRIGRPDLPRWFGDGGLIDVNGVPEYVLAQLPGMTLEQAGRIIADRTVRGPYTSVYDLTLRHPDLRLNPAALNRFVTLIVPSRSPT